MIKRQSNDDGSEAKKRALEYLCTQHVLTLATHGKGGVWSAALYYVNVDFKLIFLSAPSTRHVKNLVGNSHVAVSINENNIEWDTYRRSAITNLIKETKQMLLDVRPDCKLSAAVKPNLPMARNRYFQEWDVWLAAGYIDWVMPMNYTPDISKFAENIDIIYDHLPRKYRDRIIMGIALYNQDELAAIDKIRYTEITNFKGISLFSYNVIVDEPDYARQLFK